MFVFRPSLPARQCGKTRSQGMDTDHGSSSLALCSLRLSVYPSHWRLAVTSLSSRPPLSSAPPASCSVVTVIRSKIPVSRHLCYDVELAFPAASWSQMRLSIPLHVLVLLSLPQPGRSFLDQPTGYDTTKLSRIRWHQPTSAVVAPQLSVSAASGSERESREDGRDPYIAPLLDSMARRLQRLQRLDDQNDLFTPVPTPEVANVDDDANNGTINFQSTKRGESKERNLLPKQPKHFGISAGRIEDEEQLNSISANAPAVLLQSGPGTGKSSVLAARIAYLLQSGQTEAENMVTLSFTNRDAAAIKERALELLYPTKSDENATDSGKVVQIANAGGISASATQRRKELGNKLWSGTVHAFASGILKKYARQKGGSPRIVAAKDMHKMVKASITSIVGSGDNTDGRRRSSLTISNENAMKTYRHRFNAAMEVSNQNMRVVVANVVRCIDLWKESGLLLPALPYSGRAGHNISAKSQMQSKDTTDKTNQMRQNCVEMAVRWGVPQSTAILALDVYPEYQNAHAEAGTADPSDLASLARDFLVANPDSLSALRAKLKHVILDEYQDVSVSQHALLRLVLRGREEESTKQPRSDKGRRPKTQPICYDVPRLFCAGDSNQSLYGWRGAEPSLTVDKFLEDYPQGVLIPLGTNYRLPRSIMEAASKLISANNKHDSEEEEVDSMTTFVVSPAASTAMASKILQQPGLSRPLDVGPKEEELDLKKILSESCSTISIQELWDSREEAKFIAASIRKRSKERIQRCSKALAQLVDARVRSSPSAGEEWSLFDPTDVAIVVRSSSELNIIQEMFLSHGIPYDDKDARIMSTSSRVDNKIAPLKPRGKDAPMHIKPVKLITMHRCKGDEFDDVYLCGWAEGTFPHSSAVSAGRLDEERRLAYVALTRARQRAVITYPSTERVPHIGPGGRRKHISSQAKPSRFLRELMPKTKVNRRGKKSDSISWSDDYGIKYSMAGENLPGHFAKSYKVPEGYRPERDASTSPSTNGSTALATDTQAALHTATNPIALTDVSPSDLVLEGERESDTDAAQEGGEHLLSLIQHALVEMSDLRIKGACKLYTKTFKEMLQDFGISRGSALVFVDKKRSDSTSIEELANASDDEITSKALSKCTAKELGHFLAYLILSVDNVEE